MSSIYCLCHTPDLVFQAEVEKNKNYPAVVTACHAHFTPLCFSVDGIAGLETVCFIKRLVSDISSCWEKSYSEVLCCKPAFQSILMFPVFL